MHSTEGRCLALKSPVLLQQAAQVPSAPTVWAQPTKSAQLTLQLCRGRETGPRVKAAYRTAGEEGGGRGLIIKAKPGDRGVNTSTFLSCCTWLVGE